MKCAPRPHAFKAASYIQHASFDQSEHKESKRSKATCRFAYGQLMIISKGAGTSDTFDEDTVPRLSLKAQEGIVLRHDVEGETSPTD